MALVLGALLDVAEVFHRVEERGVAVLRESLKDKVIRDKRD